MADVSGNAESTRRDLEVFTGTNPDPNGASAYG